MVEVVEGFVFFFVFFRAAIASGLVTDSPCTCELLLAVAEACSPQRFRDSRGECGCDISSYLTLLSLATCMRLYSSIPQE
jgi:hypothetical protein